MSEASIKSKGEITIAPDVHGALDYQRYIMAGFMFAILAAAVGRSDLRAVVAQRTAGVEPWFQPTVKALADELQVQGRLWTTRPAPYTV